MQSARRAQDELGADIVVVKKTSKEYSMEKDPPPCPSVMVSGRLIVRNDTVAYEVLKAEILSNGRGES